MTIPKQEKRFEYKGFPCVILFMPMGYRCGYVGLPKDNKYYGKGYDEILVDCHCGLTYSNSGLYYQSDADTWWIGFDCGHCCDGYDVATAKELYADNEDALKQIAIMGATGYYAVCNEENPIRTLEYCEEQCKGIVDQLQEMGIKGDEKTE